MVADQPATTHPTDGTPMSSLAATTTSAIDDAIDDVIDETTTSTSGDESIVATIAPLFDEGPESDRGGGRTLSLVAARTTTMRSSRLTT